MSSADGDPIRVLHVDDDPDFREVAAQHLERRHEDVTVVTEGSAADGLDRLAEDDVDCVVSDHDMPEEDGLEFLKAVREAYPRLPFILFTGKGNEEIASDAISAGVTEYLQKGTGTDQYALLANRIERAVAETRAKTALEESERMLSTLISNLPGMVYRCRNEPGWPMTFVSDGARDLTGYAPAALESGDVTWGEEVVLEADRDRVWDEVQRALRVDEPFEVTYQITTESGDERWVWERGRAIDSETDPAVIEGFVTDITERKERERELQTEREFTEDVVNALEDVFCVVTVDGRFIRWNDKLCEVTGYSDDEIEELVVLDFFAEADHETVVEATIEAVETGSATFEAMVETRDGSRIPFEFRGTALTDSAGELIGVSGVGRDVSERRERERTLERHQTIVEAVGDPMYALDADGVFTFVNDAMEALSGYAREALVGEHISKIMTDEDVDTGAELISDFLEDEDAVGVHSDEPSVANAPEDAGEQRSPSPGSTASRQDAAYETFEMDVVTRDGEHVPCENHVALLPLEDGRFRGTAGVVRDITERKERERRLEEFASVVSHDLRNPLNVVQGRAKLAAETDDVDHLETAIEATERMERLIDDLLHLARQGRSVDEVETVTLEDAASLAWEHVVAPTATLRVETDRSVEADRDRLAELLENLFRNAVEHGSTSPRSQAPGDAVGVNSDEPSVANAPEDAVGDAPATDADGGITIRVGETATGFFVEDDGDGIDADRRDRVFERGFTTDQDGTGFGLAIVERIADAHGWSVSVHEGRDGGARFEIDT